MTAKKTSIRLTRDSTTINDMTVEHPQPSAPTQNAWDALHSHPLLHWSIWSPVRSQQWFWAYWWPTIPFQCPCTSKFMDMICQSGNEPDFSGALEFWKWSHRMHNAVSVTIGKSEFGESEMWVHHWARIGKEPPFPR